MNKSSEKRKNKAYNPIIIDRLKEKYGLSVRFLYQSLRGERNSETSLRIQEDYKKMEKAAKAKISRI